MCSLCSLHFCTLFECPARRVDHDPQVRAGSWPIIGALAGLLGGCDKASLGGTNSGSIPPAFPCFLIFQVVGRSSCAPYSVLERVRFFILTRFSQITHLSHNNLFDRALAQSHSRHLRRGLETKPCLARLGNVRARVQTFTSNPHFPFLTTRVTNFDLGLVHPPLQDASK